MQKADALDSSRKAFRAEASPEGQLCRAVVMTRFGKQRGSPEKARNSPEFFFLISHLKSSSFPIKKSIPIRNLKTIDLRSPTDKKRNGRGLSKSNSATDEYGRAIH